jgi:hypothetical protein
MLRESDDGHLKISPLRTSSLIRRVHYECSAESMTTAFGDFNARRGRQDVFYIYYNTNRVYSNLSHVGGRQQVLHITKYVQYKH